MKKVWKILSIFIILYFLISFWNTATQKAAVKPFWYDELNELNITCRCSFMRMIREGAFTQCSAPPFYYIVSKYILSKWIVDGSESMQEILIKSRIISKASVVSLFFILIIILIQIPGLRWIYFPLVLFSFLDFIGSEEGHILWASTETRPYGFWTFMVTLNLLLLYNLELKYRKNKSLSTTMFILFSIQSFFLMATATPGIIQWSIPFSIAFCLWKRDRILSFLKSKNIYGTLILFVGIGIAIYYCTRELCNLHPFYGNTWGTIFQFFTGYRTPVMFMLMIFGWIHVIIHFDEFVSKMVIGQIIILLSMIIIVHLQKYHFVPRVFIMGHFLSFFLAIAGCKQIDHLFRIYFKEKIWIANIIVLFMISISFYHSESMQQIVKCGSFSLRLEPASPLIDQRTELLFPLCSD
ncbi:hypothetical protein C4565_05610 [Candidatus Parcubacteria bacterium]|nr:MAG: hypothetical protein C4565_05610 [Candidatus Parcubacteria bacterium]